jgi:glycosyltransferase involved in cell wall biosynthesis
MSGMQVVHLARGRDWRGGERQVRLLARTLATRTPITQWTATAAGSRLASALREDGQAVLPLPWRVAYDPRALAALLSHLHRLKRSSASLLLHAHDSHALSLGILAGQLTGIPLVATRRSVSPPGRLWRRPARVIAISGAVADALRVSGVRADGISIIPSGIDLDSPAVARAGAAPGAFRIVAAGALTAEKGHATLIEAFALVQQELPEATLDILGEGRERDRLMARVRALRLESRLFLRGEVAEPRAALSGAALFVQPSLREALGTAVLEAMAAGVPVIASATGGLTELLADGAGILVPPGDAPALAAAIRGLRQDRALAAETAATAARRVRCYDAPAMADRVVEVYRSALGDP